jgi:thiol-disulfide isomerase/thioredoxin
MRTSTAVALALAFLCAAVPARADRKQVFSLQGLDCVSCVDEIKDVLDDVQGFRKLQFDKKTVEMTVWLADGVEDDVGLAAVDRGGFRAVVGPGHGAWKDDAKPWPDGADVKFLTRDGSAVGALAKHRVPGKFTIFDVYADWCAPCRLVDDHLRKVVAGRPDVAVRKLNVVDFDSPLGLELGDAIQGLPYLVVYDPAGKRTVIEGLNTAKIDRAIAK